MCETKDTCNLSAKYWVQARREVAPSGSNILACPRHLPLAVHRVGTKNREAGWPMSAPHSDGVIVKTRMPDGSWQ